MEEAIYSHQIGEKHHENIRCIQCCKKNNSQFIILPHSARRKDLSYPKGIEGWAEESVLYSSVTSQPASHPDRLTSKNILNGITHQPMVESSSNFKLKLREPNQNLPLLVLSILQMKTTSNGRRPQNIKNNKK